MRQLDPDDETKVLANSIPGINVMTRKVDVEPGHQVDAIAQIYVSTKRWNFTVGYNFWAKEKEDVSLNACEWTSPGKFGLIASGARVKCNWIGL